MISFILSFLRLKFTRDIAETNSMFNTSFPCTFSHFIAPSISAHIHYSIKMTQHTLKCNTCIIGSLDGICYRTSCQHLFCESCASKVFSNSCICPLCNTTLSEQDVIETNIGVTHDDSRKEVFQMVLQSNQLGSIIHNSQKLMNTSMEVNNFIQSQLFIELESIRNEKDRANEHSEMTKRTLVEINKNMYFRPTPISF